MNVYKSKLSSLLLITFIVVAVFSFLHFYSMLYFIDDMGMESHAPCLAYLQISEIVLQNPLTLMFLNLWLGIVLSSLVKILMIFKNVCHQSSFWRKYLIKIKPKLFLNFSLSQGLIHPKLYA